MEKLKKGEVIKEVSWNWDVLASLIIGIIIFPTWIRDVRYYRVGWKKKKKQ